MEKTFLSLLPIGFVTIMLMALMLIAYWVSVKLTEIIKKKNTLTDLSVLERFQGPVFGFLSLIMAFTFNLSDLRYEQRRTVIIEETNYIGTALLRCDLYSDSTRNELRKDFKDYINARIAYYRAGNDEKKIQQALMKSKEISLKIWNRAATESKDPKVSIVRANQMIPALNSMIDIVTTRDAMRVANIPDAVILLLFILSIMGSFIAGFGSDHNKSSGLIISLISVIVAVSVYVILYLDRPRQGIITNYAINTMIELQETIK
jgi:hypothetical protein